MHTRMHSLKIPREDLVNTPCNKKGPLLPEQQTRAQRTGEGGRV
jgi:hypothetical protein